MLRKQIPPKGCRIVVAMSGGVDSSVTAAWLKKMGYDVIGISLQVQNLDPATENTFGACTSMKNIDDARGVAEKMGFPFYVANMEKEFRAYVVDDFLKEYLNGRTPNPCVRCNELIKFQKLLEWAKELDANYLATGHYANIRYNGESKHWELTKAQDLAKDQSYFLFRLKQDNLSQIYFPNGEYTKDQVRQLAKKLDLPVADKKESQEICFVQERNYKDYIEAKVSPSLFRPGRIIDTCGEERATHTGIHQFTIGQQKGLGIQSKEPLFVVHILRDTNEVVVGPEKDLYRTKCIVSHLNWILPPELDRTTELAAKIRYRAPEKQVDISPLLDNRLEVRFREPQKSITPGQAMVFYKKDICLGGGWIEDFS